MKRPVVLFRRFAHRRNADTTTDSICSVCFLTVGSASAEGNLKWLESTHPCELSKPASAAAMRAMQNLQAART